MLILQRYYLLINSISKEEKNFLKEHPFRKISKWMIENKLLEDDFITKCFIENHSYSISWKYTKAREKIGTMMSNDFWSRFSGYLTVNLFEQEGAIEFLDGHLHSMVFLHLAFCDIIEKSYYFEIYA